MSEEYNNCSSATAVVANPFDNFKRDPMTLCYMSHSLIRAISYTRFTRCIWWTFRLPNRLVYLENVPENYHNTIYNNLFFPVCTFPEPQFVKKTTLSVHCQCISMTLYIGMLIVRIL